MSTHANYVIIFGTRISKPLAKKINKDFYNHQGRICRRYVEKRIEHINLDTEGSYLWDIEQYLKRDEEGDFVRPIAPIWESYSEEDIKKMDKDFDTFLRDKIISKDPSKLEDMWENIWHPCSDTSMEPVLGLRTERLFSGIAWDFHKVLKKEYNELPSTKPWETGVYKKDKGVWGRWKAFNGENIILDRNIKISDEDYESIRKGYDTKQGCIDNQKRIWDFYNKKRKPYPMHPNEMWWYSYPQWHEVDVFLETCKEVWPEIVNDPLKYKKILLFYWS